MLKVDLDEDNVNKLEMSGDLPTLLANVSFLVAKIYVGLLGKDKLAGELFKLAFQVEIANEDSPVWNLSKMEYERKRAN